MWNNRKRNCALLRLSLLSLLCLLLFSGFGICSESRMYQISEKELTTLETNLETLEMHNETLKSILTTQDSELTEALNLLTRSQEELAKLKAELQIARNETQSAKDSLQIANDELQKAATSFKAYEAERDKTETRLRNQRNIWEVLCAVAVGFAVAR